MPVTGYYGPHITPYYKEGYSFPDYVEDEYFKMISEMGINVISYNSIDYASNPDVVEKYLDLGEKYGLGIFVTDSNIYECAGSSTLSAEELGARIANYNNYPAFCGVYLVDEPDGQDYILGTGENTISMYGDLAHVLQEELGIFCYSNMLPCDNYERDKDNYEKYVDEFCETFQPEVLMWDYYVFDSYGDIPTYFWNMNLMREKSKEYRIPFWSFIQAGGRWRSDDPYLNSETYHPTESEFHWNVNTSLAFGAQGIQYFPLIQPKDFAFRQSEKEADFLASGLIGADGSKNQWYYYAQDINKHIAVIDEVLMNSTHAGIIFNASEEGRRKAGAYRYYELDSVLDDITYINDTFKIAEGIDTKWSYSWNLFGGSEKSTDGDRAGWRELYDVKGDAMVGCFNYGGKTALYVVNYSMETAQNITLEFDNQYHINVIQKANSSYQNAESLTLNMAAGEGVLLVVE